MSGEGSTATGLVAAVSLLRFNPDALTPDEIRCITEIAASQAIGLSKRGGDRVPTFIAWAKLTEIGAELARDEERLKAAEAALREAQDRVELAEWNIARTARSWADAWGLCEDQAGAIGGCHRWPMQIMEALRAVPDHRPPLSENSEVGRP